MRHDPDLIECRTCGQTFDLARQWYYDNQCPSCKQTHDPDALDREPTDDTTDHD